MGKHRKGERSRALARHMTLWLTVGLVASVVTAISAAAGTAAAAADGGCIDKLEIETPGETASEFGSVQLEPGETFTANVRHWTSEPTGATWRTGFNSEAGLSILRADGFPADSVRGRGFAADGPWQADGFSDDGVFSYTNPSNSTRTEFVLHVGAWNRPSTDIIGRTELSGFSTCVSAHTPPERPAATCATMPAMRADSSDVVRSEPFFMPASGRLDLDIMDSRAFGWHDDGYILQRHGDWNYRARLYDAETGDQITSRTYSSEGFYWTREAYVDEQGATVFNDSSAGNVIFELATWFTRGGGQPQTTPIAARVNGESICLESTDSAVIWDAAPSCRPDDTSGITAQVTNKTGASADYTIQLRNPATNQWVHGSHAHTIASGDTATVALGGIGPGRWKVVMVENGQPLSPATWMTFSSDDCNDSVTWPNLPTCAVDFTPAIDVLVRNDGITITSYQVEVRSIVDGSFVHASNVVSLLPGRERNIRLGGIPNGSYNVVVVADGVDLSESRYFFDLANCDEASSTAVDIGQAGCSSDPALGATLAFTITNSGGTAQNYRVEVGPRSHEPVSVPPNTTITFILRQIPEGIHTATVQLEDGSQIAIRENIPFGCSDQIALCPTNTSFAFRYGKSTWSQIPGNLPYINAAKIRVDTTGAEGRVHVMVNGTVHPDSASVPANSGTRTIVSRDREALTKWNRDAWVQVAVVPDGDNRSDAIPCGTPRVVTAPVTVDGSTLDAPDGQLICTLHEVKGATDRTRCEALFSNLTSERYFWLSQLPDIEHGNNVELNCGAYEEFGRAVGLWPGFIAVDRYSRVTSQMCDQISGDLNTGFRAKLNELDAGLGQGKCLVIFAFSGGGPSGAGYDLIDYVDNPNCSRNYTKTWPDLESFIRNDWCVNFPDWEFAEYEIDGSTRCTAWQQSAPSSSTLARNLRAVGQQPTQTAAHHIVAGDQDDPLIDEARAILINFQIDINAAENGVFLPRNCNSANPSGHVVHSKIHTAKYFTYVNTLLRQATTKAEVIEALDDVRQMLRTSNAWQFYTKPCKPNLATPALTVQADTVTFAWFTAHAALDYQIYWYDGDGRRFDIDRTAALSIPLDISARSGEVCARVRGRNDPLMEKPGPFSTNVATMPCVTIP